MPDRQNEFEQAALPHTGDLLRCARRLTGNTTVAEDLVQESLLNAWRSFHQLREGSNARAWLYRIMVNNWFNDLRRAKRAPAVEIRRVAGGAHAAAEINQALDQLPEEQRAAFLLVVVQGFTCQEGADILGIPIGTVMSRISRARDALRGKLSAGRKGTAAAASSRIRRMPDDVS